MGGRRFFLKNGLLAMAAVIGASWPTKKEEVLAGAETKTRQKKYGMIIDLN